MKHKILALLLCIAVILTIILPGSMAVSADANGSGSQMTIGSQDECICESEDDTHSESCELNDADDSEKDALSATYSNLASNYYQENSEDKIEGTSPENGEYASSGGVVLNKKASANDDGSFIITLEAYATGSKVISSVNKDVPTDIVLVIDQSGSMKKCIVCGKEISNSQQTHTIYSKVTTIDTSKKYYILNKNWQGDSEYKEVTYCSGTHASWQGTTSCSGGAGWYTNTNSWSHTTNNKYTPKTSDYLDGEQFYEQKTETCTSRLDAMKTAVTTFVDSVNEKAKGADKKYGTEDDVNHRIAVVGFGTGNTSNATSSNPKYENTEVFIGSSQYNYNEDARKFYASAFQDMNTQIGYNNVIASKNSFAASGATQVDLGIEMANGIFKANPIAANEKRNRVMIVFTDGFPSDWANYSSTVADDAIENAEETKDTYNATVYTVGIFDGADATSAGNKNGDDTQKTNWFLQNVSSNDGVPQDPSYYLSAGDTDSLNSIFQKIADQIESGGSSSTLDSSTVIKDIITPQFQLPKGTTGDDITLETYACTGKSGNDYTWSKNSTAMGATASINANGNVDVTGFDFAANYVGTVTNNGAVSYRGNKLVIKFKIQPKDKFLGGNNVLTNGAESGIYDGDGNNVATFPQPEANVDIKSNSETLESNVYLGGYYGQTLTGEQIKNNTKINIEGVEFDLSKDDYGLEDWQKAYVDIEVTITDKDGNTYTSSELADDLEYTVTVTIKPKEEAKDTSVGTPNDKDGKDSSIKNTIHVFKPELTYKDSVVYYGDTAPENYNSNLTKTRWVHYATDGAVDKVDTDVTMTGTAPILTITYTPEDGKIIDNKIATKQDIQVDVSVKIGTWDVTNYVKFIHTKCDSTCTDPANGKFWLHVKTCSLIIKKNGGAEDEAYIFYIYKDNEKYTEVTVCGNSEVTIYELPVGNYSIKEDTGWSWRYTPSYDKNSAALSSNNTSDAITCTNKLEIKEWLNGFSTILKNIFGVSKSDNSN